MSTRAGADVNVLLFKALQTHTSRTKDVVTGGHEGHALGFMKGSVHSAPDSVSLSAGRQPPSIIIYPLTFGPLAILSEGAAGLYCTQFLSDSLYSSLTGSCLLFSHRRTRRCFICSGQEMPPSLSSYWRD